MPALCPNYLPPLSGQTSSLRLHFLVDPDAFGIMRIIHLSFPASGYAWPGIAGPERPRRLHITYCISLVEKLD